MSITSPDRRRLEAESRFVQREVVVLAVLAVVALGAFQFTRLAANREQRATMRDAAAWYDIGVRQLQQGRVDEAVTSLRHATTRDRSNRTYGAALARALVAASRTDDARLALLDLRDGAPEDPQINVELARLAAGRQDTTEASRYYRSALYGVWDAGRDADRTRLHVEFIRFLLAHDQPAIALAELLALVPNLPGHAASYVEAGQLLLAAGDAARAREQFVRALGLEPGNRDALAGAGEATFAGGDYAAARRYLRAVTNPAPRAARLRDLSELILATDPLAPQLAAAERQRRLVAALTQAMPHAVECRASAITRSAGIATRLEAAYQEADAFRSKVSQGARRMSRDDLEAGTEIVYRLEQAAADACGPPAGLDEALLFNGRRHGAAAQ